MGLWFAAAYLFVAPTLTQRSIVRHIDAECNRSASSKVCSCVLSDIQTAGRIENALFISSFGFSDPRPRQAVYHGSGNSYVQYVAREATEPQRRDTCKNNPLSMVQAQEEAEARQKKHFEDRLKQQQQYFDQMEADAEKQRQDQIRKLEDAKNKMAAAARDARNCEFGNTDLVEDAERKCRLASDTNEELMSWGELAVEKSEQLRWHFKRKWGLR